MLIYNRYISNKVLTGFLALVSMLVLLIWFSRAVPFVKYITENGVELSQFFYLFILILPWLLLFIIPVSLFAAILLIYNRLIITNEITILKNSGLTKFAISRPAISIAVIISLFCFLISFYLMPYANKKLRVSRADFKSNYTNLSFNPQTFETLKNLTIYAKNRDESNRLYGVLLHDERSSNYSITITAKVGNIQVENNAALLYMEEGTVQKFNYKDKKTEILDFDNYVFNLSENQQEDMKKRWKAKERYLGELLHPEADSEESELAKYRAELHQRFTYPLLPLAFTIIALSCILHGSFNRKGNLKNIIMSVSLSVIFLIITIACQNLVESSPKFIPLLYSNFVIFFIIGFRFLKGNYRKKR